jgi:PAS domain S-box-containing protein
MTSGLVDEDTERFEASSLRHSVLTALLVALAYFVGAELAFFIGTLSDKIFAPFWPPNIVLFCVFLLVPIRRWWLYTLVAFPAHVVAELGVGMTMPALLVAFATNWAVAALNAGAVKLYAGGRPWLGDPRKALIYVGATALVSPAIVALGGAFVPIMSGGTIGQYWDFWAQWYASNALGSLTLAPVVLTWLCEPWPPISQTSQLRRLEALLLTTALVVVCVVTFEVGAGTQGSGFLPALLYLPLPLIVWATVRFGIKGASGAIFVVTIVLIWRTLKGHNLFTEGNAESNVLALQTFLIGLATPVLLLGAAINAIRSAEQTIRDSQERTAFAFASAHIALWEYSTASERFWSSANCNAMLGLPPDVKLTRGSFLGAVHPQDVAAAKDVIRTTASAGEPTTREFRVNLPDGGTRWVLARGYAQRDKGGEIVQTAGILTDVTDRKANELEAEVQRREVSHLMRVSVMGELAGAIAHELNQPLAAILANAEAARRMLRQGTPDVAEAGAALDDIVQENKRASEVIRRMRRLLRKGDSRPEIVNLNDLIESTIKLIHSELISRHVKVVMDLGADLPVIWGDPVQLQQVALNLVMNAMEAMNLIPPSQRVLTIASRHLNAESIEIVVKDRGHGLAPVSTKQLFEPFFTTKDHGLGLGLSICLTIVKSHGGELSLANHADGGVTAILTLPSRQVQTMAAK